MDVGTRRVGMNPAWRIQHYIKRLDGSMPGRERYELSWIGQGAVLRGERGAWDRYGFWITLFWGIDNGQCCSIARNGLRGA